MQHFDIAELPLNEFQHLVRYIEYCVAEQKRKNQCNVMPLTTHNVLH